MRQRCLVLALVGVLFAASPSLVSAQPASEGFEMGHMDVGPVVGMGGVGGAFSVGGRFERAFRDMPEWRGLLGLAVAIDYYSFEQDFAGFGNDFDFTYMPISVLMNYHFRLDNRRIDPFFGAGIAYQRVDFDCGFDPLNVCDDFANDGITFHGHGGIRYFWRPKLALFADVSGVGAALNIGIMYKLSD
jgi:hypothetical protein